LWLIGHVYFDFSLHGENFGVGLNPSNPPCQKIGISWIMNNCNSKSTGSSIGKNLRSVHFRGTTTRLSVPNHCVDYFMGLLQDVQQRWDEIFFTFESNLNELVGPLLLNPSRPHRSLVLTVIAE
jgi:hypothetical protein